MRARLDDLSYIQPDLLVKANEDMLNQCQLFEAGGNYSEDEVSWYRGQMEDINQMINTAKEERLEKVNELADQIARLKVEPVEHFFGAYKQNIEELSAKDGLGKTYGQPRRYAQERLRSEMTKCENAQRGINNAIDKLEELCEKAVGPQYTPDFDYTQEAQTLSLEIRVTLISIIRMMINYGRHLEGFSTEGPSDLPRISQLENSISTEL